MHTQHTHTLKSDLRESRFHLIRTYTTIQVARLTAVLLLKPWYVANDPTCRASQHTGTPTYRIHQLQDGIHAQLRLFVLHGTQRRSTNDGDVITREPEHTEKQQK